MIPSILPFCFLMLLFATNVISIATATQPSLSKPGCLSHCGNLTIPYPFGISPDCSLSSGYSLFCDTSVDPPKTFIPLHENIEVLSISPSEVRIRNKVAFSCFDPRGELVSSQTSFFYFPQDFPYTFSSSNRFTVIGCDVVGEVKVGVNDFSAACESMCLDPKDVTKGYCSNNGCCQMSIPKGLKDPLAVTLHFEDRANVTWFNPCAYGFVGDEERFTFDGMADLDDPTFINSTSENVPVVLDWVVGRESCLQAQRNLSSYMCQPNTNCTDANIIDVVGYRCTCYPGFEGNPYLTPGCTEINKCADESSNRCSHECKNTAGTYSCYCPPGFSGDGYIDGTGCSPHPSLLGMKLALGISLGALLLLICVSWTYLLIRRRRLMKLKERFFEQNGGLLLQKQLSAANQMGMESAKIFRVEELKTATKNFSEDNILGRGGFGTVYKGVLRDNRIVAIKKSTQVDQSQIEQFINEVVILSGINHRNVVKLLGCCLETEVPLLVYEFISNGTLFEHIHDRSGGTSWLSWSNCLRIAVEAAEALAYLHSAASVPVIHRDIKSTNILIDDNYDAKISDFGASRLVPMDYTLLTTVVQGTLGYLDPECFFTSQLTEKSDVYSFGVVLAELLTRRKPFSSEPTTTADRTLAACFVMSMREGHLFEMIDPQLIIEAPQEQIVIVAELVGKCLSGKGEDRPAMKDVAIELDKLRKQLTTHPWENQQVETTNLSSDVLHGDLYPAPLDSFQKDMISEMNLPR